MRYILLLTPLLLTTACLTDDDVDDRNDEITDVDGDGFESTVYGGDDCDDDNSDINPDIEETPYDGLDNDCDEATLDNDLDEDGFDLEEDCDDEDASVNPSADELCDGIDNNCDEEIDEATAIDAAYFYLDSDEDGYGDEIVTTQSCEDAVEGYLPEPEDGLWDCDDDNIDANPDMVETCATEFDDDCDGTANTEDSLECTTFFFDSDGDGFGASSMYSCLCGPDDASSMTSLEGTDCDDSDSDINPGSMEIIGDELDSDCDQGDDTFELLTLDTRSATNLYGPRLTSYGDDISIGWVADTATPSTGFEYDTRAVSTFDGTDTSSGELFFFSLGESIDIGTMADTWDFSENYNYWVFASATYDATSNNRALQLRTIDKLTQAIGGMEVVDNTPQYQDIQLTIDANNDVYLTACGIDSGFKVVGDTLYDMAENGGAGAIQWGILLKDYYIDNNVWVFSGDYSVAQYDICEYGDSTDFPYWRASNSNTEVIDQLVILNESYMANLTDYSGSGVLFADMEFSRQNDTNAWTRVYEYSNVEYLYIFTTNTNYTVLTQKAVDVDVSTSPSGTVVVCTVFEDGTLDVFYSEDPANGAPLDRFNIDLSSVGNAEECAVVVTESIGTATLTVAARVGDEIVYGFAYID